jgi:hypothetical protein
MHHRTIQINHQPDATFFQSIILTFIYSSTCFGRSPAHHQELNACSSSLWFYFRIVVIAVLCSWSGRLSIQTKRTKEHRTTEEEMERPILFWGSRNRKHVKFFMNITMMMMMMMMIVTLQYFRFHSVEWRDQ